ncbi:MAG: DUF1206 domain-containing protein [Dermatophilus congolensis]|nr:DUF1206 domain-containing protein [Dermatophilus congolensis]
MNRSEITNTARQVGDNPIVETGARIGYAANGVLHLMIGWLAVQLATQSYSGDADQSGALAVLANNPVGRIGLWIGVAGWLGLSLWQLTESVLPLPDIKDRVKAVSKAILYATLSWSCFSFLRGSGSDSSEQSVGATQTLLDTPGGMFLVIALGIVVLGVGGYHVIKGAKKGFLEDLKGHPGRAIEIAGKVGYIAKGIALLLVAYLFFRAASLKNAEAATGLDGALRTILEQPFGTGLLIAVGIGFVAYAVYSFGRARYARV